MVLLSLPLWLRVIDRDLSLYVCMPVINTQFKKNPDWVPMANVLCD